jgi:hypothetical protein
MYVCMCGWIDDDDDGGDDLCRRRSCVIDLVTDYHYRDSIMT